VQLSDEGLKRLVTGIVKVIREAIRDPVVAEQLRAVVEETVREPKEVKPRDEAKLTESQRVVRKVYLTYEAVGATDKPPPSIIMQWFGKWGTKERFADAMRAMREGGILEMPVAYQIKVMNSWIKAGHPKMLRRPVRGSHTSAGSGDGDLAALEERMKGGDA
jgi:hypothetical protein